MRAVEFVAALLVGGALGYFGPAAWLAVSRRLKRARQERFLRRVLEIPVDQEVQPFKKSPRRRLPTDRPRTRSAVIAPTARDRTRVHLDE